MQRIKPIKLNEDEISRLLNRGYLFLYLGMTPKPKFNPRRQKWEFENVSWGDCSGMEHAVLVDLYAPYNPGDILYVAEPWAKVTVFAEGLDPSFPLFDDFLVKSQKGNDPRYARVRWCSASTMPPEAAHIFLRVSGVSVIRTDDSWSWCVKLLPTDKPEGWPSND